MDDILKELSKPFHPSQISWKPGTIKGERAMAMPYADLRAYMNRLDEVCGMNWSIEYKPWGEDRIIACLTINGVTRCSTGEMAAQDEKNEIGGTVAEAQAAKRACAMFGLGRYLYLLPTGWADYDSQRRQFTEGAKAKLTGILVQHYRRATEGNSTDGDEIFTREGQGKTNPPMDDPRPYFVRDWHKLTGKEYDLVKWVATLHDKSDGPCTAKQYQYLVSIVDALTHSEHNYVLSLLCQSEISSDNLPGSKVAAELLKILPENVTEKDADGKVVKDENGKHVMVKNPAYRADICQMIAKMAEAAEQVA